MNSQRSWAQVAVNDPVCLKEMYSQQLPWQKVVVLKLQFPASRSTVLFRLTASETINFHRKLYPYGIAKQMNSPGYIWQFWYFKLILVDLMTFLYILQILFECNNWLAVDHTPDSAEKGEEWCKGVKCLDCYWHWSDHLLRLQTI